MFCDIALRYDPTTRSCDLVLEAGSIAIDRTPGTPMLVALGSDRRARGDDELPQGNSPFLAPDAVNPRRGWVGDALDAQGRRLGSLLWLLEREKQTDAVRLRASGYAADALAGVAARHGIQVSTEAEWLSRGVLGLGVRLGGARVRLLIAAGG